LPYLPRPQARLTAAQSRADALNAATANLFCSFVAHNKSTTVPLTHTGTGSSTSTSRGSSTPTLPRTPTYNSKIEGAWRAVAAKNAALDPFQASADSRKNSLLSMFRVS